MPQLASSLQAFDVEEVPLFRPCGSGQFTWLWVEKENLHTDSLIQILAKELNVKSRLIGIAGRKDKLSVSRQFVSVPGSLAESFSAQGEQFGGRWHVLESIAHDHPLKLGQLKANRFSLKLEDVDLDQLNQAIKSLSDKPLLNVFGPQRFGHQHHNLQIMQAWSAGAYQEAIDLLAQEHRGDQGMMKHLLRRAQRGGNPQDIIQSADKRVRKYLASVAQSFVFNCVAQARAAAGLASTVREGDLLLRNGKSAFHARADELDQLQQDMKNHLVATTAPLPGWKVRRPGELIDKQEREWAESADINWSLFDRGSIFASPGERRRLLLDFIEPLTYDAQSQCLQFALPAGAFATIILEALGIANPRRDHV